jgi:hypothetical protein
MAVLPGLAAEKRMCFEWRFPASMQAQCGGFAYHQSKMPPDGRSYIQ